MLKIIYAPTFIRRYEKLESELQAEVLIKLNLFQDKDNHKSLNVHKLHGHFSDRYSFSVNYRIRIIFRYLSKSEVAILTVGDHDVYDK